MFTFNPFSGKLDAISDLTGYLTSLTGLRLDQSTPQTITGGSPIFDILTASKVVFTDSTKHLTSTGIGTSSQFIKGDGSLDGSTYLTSVTAHNLLSTTHGDTTAASVVRGDIIIGSGATPKWTRLAVGASTTYLAGGTEPSWATLNQAAVAGLTTASSPAFVTVKLSGLTDGYVPYHVADATGLANSVIYTDGTKVGVGITPVSLFEVPGNTDNSSGKFGSYELQSYAVNNAWLGENIYFNSGFIRRAAGYGTILYFAGTELQTRFFDTGAAGSVAGSVVIPFKTNFDGTVGLGGSIDYIQGSYTGALVKISPTGIGVDIPAYNTTNAGLRLGNIEFQPFSLNNSWFGDNIYYNGGFKYRNTGYGTLFYMFNGDFEVRTVDTGSAGAAATPIQRFIVSQNGDVGIGGYQTGGSLTGSVLTVLTGGNVGIGVTDPDQKLEVNGSVHIDGDTYWETDGSGLPYGYCYGDHIAWQQVNPVQNTWYEISDADMADGQLNLVTHDGSGKLTVTKAGRYLINWQATAESSVANKHIEFAISVSGTENAAGMAHEETKAVNAEFNVGSTAILDLAASATIEISIRTTDAGNVNLDVQNLNITLTQVGGT